MSSRLPPLRALTCFEAVARLNSFSRAADSLNITQSAVSHQIRLLEDHLGESLFIRHGRYLSLTEDGRAYHEAVAAALHDIQQATDRLQGREERSLRLALYSSFAVRWLIPRLPSLGATYPELDLSLEMTSESPVLSDRGGDCFITLVEKQRGYTMEQLYAERLFAICSRQFWEKVKVELRAAGEVGVDDRDFVLHPECLQRYTLLSAHSLFGSPNEDWRRWLAVVDCPLRAETRIQQFSHILLALEAARHHQGFVLANDYMYAEPEDPDLVRLPCHSLFTGDCFYVAYKTSRRNEPAIRKLRQWLHQEARASGLAGH
ncbi:MAG: LysR family transcriptional regulator [Natronospirillum sp.]|uniref:LysR family transcriptional regulator n=1 Tax=Natronospirillum sp. TaxID=2812955 RepID=UPI0025E13156|nr:LysR family transcriptional regulator [Natronospirillum sp.]MCH8550380.1 LysR family transcriptional regulator [Natronospirillum sp.]